MLAHRLRTFTPKFTPITLSTRHIVLTGNPVKVLEEFHYRLTKLYSASAHTGGRDTDSFFDRLSLPMLTEAHKALMDRDIQISEVPQCIKDLKVGKRPGPDSYTALYYRKLADIIAPHLTAIYNSVK